MANSRSAQYWYAALFLAVTILITNAQTGVPTDLAVIRARAEEGDAEAQTQLAQVYKNLLDFGKAARWYRAAAEQGEAEAQWNLGLMLLSGLPAMGIGTHPVAVDSEKGIAWLARAASQGHERAEIDLGHCFRDGRGVKRDRSEAYKWYLLATRQGGLWRTLYLEPLISTMTAPEIEEGQKRADAFRPSPSSTQSVAKSEPPSPGSGKVKRVSGREANSGQRPK